MATTADIFAGEDVTPVASTGAVISEEFEPAPERITQTREFHGRQVEFRSFTDTQLAQLNHEASVLQNERYDADRKRKAMDRCFRTLQSMFVNEDDLDFASDLIADGSLDLRELMTIAMELVRGATQPNRQVRRGRAPRKR
jgi:hypothetical protein